MPKTEQKDCGTRQTSVWIILVPNAKKISLSNRLFVLALRQSRPARSLYKQGKVGLPAEIKMDVLLICLAKCFLFEASMSMPFYFAFSFLTYLFSALL